VKVTADTITDAQIRELRHSVKDSTVYQATLRATRMRRSDYCMPTVPYDEWIANRRLCADAWNARHGGES